MSATGVVKLQPWAQPSGTSEVTSSDGTAARHHGSAGRVGNTSVPATIRTPDSGSVSASASSTAYVVADQAVTRSWGSARYGYQRAAATTEVVSRGRSRATTSTRCPAS